MGFAETVASKLDADFRRPAEQLLLPFSLYGGADGGFKNRSLIAMLSIGSACLVAYPIYEWKFATFPSMPSRVLLNRSFVTAVVINFVYMLAAYLQLLYLSSYVYVVTDINVRNWNCESTERRGLFHPCK